MTATPVGLQASDTGSAIFLAIAIAFFVGCAIWIALNFRRVRWLPVVLMAGGAIASLQESLIDRMILLWYPADAPQVVFTAMGHHQPLYMMLIYAGFVGMGTYFSYTALTSDPSGAWKVFAGIIVMDAFFEILATASNVFYYYGRQPFQVVPDGWPLWVAFLSAAAPVLAGRLVLVLEPHLRGAETLLLAMVPPFAWAAVYFACGWPAYIALNSGSPGWLIWAAATATMAMCVATVFIVVVTMPGRRPGRVPRASTRETRAASPL